MATVRSEPIPQPAPPRKIIIELDEDEAGRLMTILGAYEDIRDHTNLNIGKKPTLYHRLEAVGVTPWGLMPRGPFFHTLSIVAPHPSGQQ